MKTRDRILQTSLRLFNEFGEPNVTTNHVADELDISPGNLYYHFRNKDEIIYYLFLHLERQIDETLDAPASRTTTLEDKWLYVHMLFEAVWEYRFLYRDLANILSRNTKLKSRFSRMVDRSIKKCIAICGGLVEAGLMEADEEEITALGYNIWLVASQWLTFQNLLSSGRSMPPGTVKPQEPESDAGRAVFQVMQMVSPYLIAPAREMIKQLSRNYL